MRRAFTVVGCGVALAALTISAARQPVQIGRPPVLQIVRQSQAACFAAATRYALHTVKLGSFKGGCAGVKLTYATIP
jgi:hypothetical protein